MRPIGPSMDSFALNIRRAFPMPPSLPLPGLLLIRGIRNTYRHFSPPGERYLDAYTIRNAEDDDEIVPVKYASRSGAVTGRWKNARSAL